MQTEITEVEIVKPEATPEELHAQITAELSRLDSIKGEAQLRIARLGGLLAQLAEGDKYRALGYRSINQYIHEAVRPFSNLGATQLYACKMAAERLLPYVEANDIEAMGITNAHALANAVRLTGRVPPKELVEAGKRQKTEEFKATVATRFQFPQDDGAVRGTWRDLSGFYATAEEWAEIERAFECAKRTDPTIPVTDPEWAQMKEVMLRMCREYLSTYATVEAREAA